MLELGRVAALDVDKRRVRLDDAGADKVVEAEEVLVLAEAVEVPPAEGQGAEVLGDDVEQAAGGGDAEGYGGGVNAFCVMRSFELEGQALC